jgi:hypothetical protein
MKKHNVSETGSVSVLRWGKTPTLLGPIERANLNHWIQFPKRYVFSLLFMKNPDDGQSPKTQYLCVLYTIVRTL